MFWFKKYPPKPVPIERKPATLLPNNKTNINFYNSNKTGGILENFSQPLIIFSDEQVTEALVNQRILLLINKLNFSQEEVLVYSKYENEKIISNVHLFWNVLKKAGYDESNFSVPLVRKRIFDSLNFENKYKAFIIISPCDLEAIFQEFIFRINRKHNNIIWFLNQDETSYEERILQELFPNHEKYKINCSSNKENTYTRDSNDIVRINPNLLNRKTYSFDSSILKFFNFDRLLFFSKRESILKQAIRIRQQALNQKFKKVLFLSQVAESDYFDCIENADSIFFDIQAREDVIKFAIEKVNNIFVVLDSDKDISKVFKKYCREFYLINLDDSFDGVCQKFEKILITCNEVIKSDLDSKFKDFIREENGVLFSKNTSSLEILIKSKLDFLWAEDTRTLFISSLVEDNFWNFDSSITKINFLGSEKKYFLELYDSIVIYEKINAGLNRFIVEALQIGKKVFVFLNSKPDDFLSIFNENCKEFIYLNFQSNLSCEVTKFKKKTLSANIVSKENEKFELDEKINKYIREDNCLVFSKKFEPLREIINTKIRYLLNKNLRILLVSFVWKIWENYLDIEKYSFSDFIKKCKDGLNIEKDFDAIIIYEMPHENLKKLVDLNIINHSNILITLLGDPKDVFPMFEKNWMKFVYLNFDSNFSAQIKFFKRTALKISSESIENEDFQPDSKIIQYVLENKCLVFSEKEAILKRLVELKIDNFFGKQILFICNAFPKIEFSISKNDLNVYDFKGFLAWYFFGETSLPKKWEQDFDEKISRFSFRNYSFDVVIFLESPKEHLKKIITKALNEVENVFVALKEIQEGVLQTFQKNSRRFVYLNFGSGSSAHIKVFNKSFLTVSSESSILEKAPVNVEKVESNIFHQKDSLITSSNKENYFSLETKKVLSDFDNALIISTEDQWVAERLAKERISLLLSKKKISSEEILFFGSNAISLNATSFWKILPNNELSSFYESKAKRKKIFDIVVFEKKYKSFIIFVPNNRGSILVELISRIRNNNTIIFFNSKDFSEGLISILNLFPSCKGYVTEKSEIGGIINLNSVNLNSFKQNITQIKDLQKDKVSLLKESEKEYGRKDTLFPSKVLKDLSKPLVILTENEEISWKLAVERVSLLRNKFGLKPSEIIVALSSDFKEERTIKAKFFWKILVKQSSNVFSLLRNNKWTKQLFDDLKFEKNYKAFIIISSLDCGIAIKELVFRIRNLTNLLWLADSPSLSEKDFLLADQMLSGYSKYKASGDGENPIIESFSERRKSDKLALLFEEDQIEDPIFSKKPKYDNDEDDPVFDNSVTFDMLEEEDENEDISGGLT